MELLIKGKPKEIAALVLELQERRCVTTDTNIGGAIIRHLQALQDRDEQEVLR